MNGKEIKRIGVLALEMATKGRVKLVDSYGDIRWFIINRISMEGYIDLYHVSSDNVEYYDVPMRDVIIT